MNKGDDVGGLQALLGDGLELRTMAWDRAATTGPATLLFSAEGDDPFTLVERSVELIAARLRTFRLRTQKPTPDWIDWFGWCTWDAFYQEVNTEGVLAGLQKARDGGVEPRWVMLDDGWQDTDGKMLQGFGAHPKKIPAGLADLVTRAKSEFNLRLFGAWHAFEGFRNALNNVFMAPFCVPDWDMFQSCREPAPFHAAARAICGGPLYISDKPGEQNFALLRKLITRDGRALRCPQPALPTRDSLFADAYGQPHLFKIQNRNATIGVLGLFNCYWNESTKGGQPVTGRYSAADIDHLPGDRFALLHATTGEVRVATRAESFEISLPPLGWELVTVAPIEHGVAVFGLAEKLNGAAALTALRWLTPTRLEITLVESGPLALHLERTPLRATVNDSTVPLVRSEGGAFIATLPDIAHPTLVLEFETTR